MKSFLLLLELHRQGRDDEPGGRFDDDGAGLSGVGPLAAQQPPGQQSSGLPPPEKNLQSAEPRQ